MERTPDPVRDAARTAPATRIAQPRLVSCRSRRPRRRLRRMNRAAAPAMFTIEVGAAGPRCRVVERGVEDRVEPEFAERDQVGIQADCRLKNARLSISMKPLKTSPSEKAASAPRDGRRLRPP